MDGDVAVSSVSLSLIAIPSASAADSLDVDPTHITTSSSVDISTSVPSSPPNSSSHENISPNAMQSSLETTEPSPQSSLVAVSDNGSKAQMDAQPSSSNLDDTVLNVSGHLDMMEHQSTNGGIADGTVTIVEEGQEWTQESDHEMKRVKVYQLMGTRWVDRGTAFCFGHFSQDGTEALLTARSERNFQEVVLTTTIRSNDVYQRQQDTLIVWTEPDGVDYALSFQEPDGCAEVWNFIQEVQRHMNGGGEDPSSIGSSSPLLQSESSSLTTANIIRTGHLPTPEMGIIPDIEAAIKSLSSRTATVKERICEYIQHEDYIKQLTEVLHVAEREESLDNLHALFSLMLTILMLNDHTMYEHILEDDLFFGVVGMLEYDPEFPSHKANYREFLMQTTRFHEPIPFRDPSIQRKIHHTYRLQFLKDVVLARALDDSTFNVLNSCIIFNQIDIINHIQQDTVFLRHVVRLYVDEDILSGGGNRKPPQPQPESSAMTGVEIKTEGDGGDKKPPCSPKLANGAIETALAPTSSAGDEAGFSHRCEVILLVQQLCVMGKNVQLPARMALFRSLVDRGILFAVQWAISLPEKQQSNKAIISAGGEVLAALLDHDINGVRGHVLKQVVALEKERVAGKKGADEAETILEMTCRVMASSKDLSVQSQVGDALKVWLDLPPDLGMPTSSSEAHPVKPPVRKDDPGTERFMDYFYKDCAKTLFTPFNTLPEWRNAPEHLHLSREETNQYVYLCDLLYNFVLQHHFRSHFFVISSSVMVRLPALFKARDKHLQHAAFRFFRLVLKQGNPNMLSQVMKFDVIKPILDLTLRESRRDSLLSCSCQEYFQHMYKENMKDMIKFCMTKHETEIRDLCKTPLGATRFRDFIQRWERNNEPPPPAEAKADKYDNRVWPAQVRSMEAEEEDYFNGDDDDLIPSISSQSWPRNGAVSPSINGLKRKRRVAIRGSPKGLYPPSSAADGGGSSPQNHYAPYRLVGASPSPLVDYDDDEPEGDDVIGPKPATGKPAPLSPRQASPSPSLTSVAEDDDEDEEDRALEALMRERPQSPAPGMMMSLRLGEKRRRADDDDDEELLERLAKAKKQDLGQKKAFATIPGRAKLVGDDPPPLPPPQKKFKVRIGAGPAVVNTAPPEAGAKDGDTG